MVTPAPAVLPWMVLLAKAVMVVLATAPPLMSTAAPAALADTMFVLLLNARFSVPATRLMSTAVPVCVPAVFQVLPVMVSVSVPVVPALRLTSIPFPPALEITLLARVSVGEPVNAAAVVRSMAFGAVDDSANPRTSAGIAAVIATALPAPPFRTGDAPAAGTTLVGDPLPLRLTGIDSPTASEIRCWPASSSMPAGDRRRRAVHENVVVGIIEVAGAVRAVERGRGERVERHARRAIAARRGVGIDVPDHVEERERHRAGDAGRPALAGVSVTV